MTHICIIGLGNTGSQTARQLRHTDGVTALTLVDCNTQRQKAVAGIVDSALNLMTAAADDHEAIVLHAQQHAVDVVVLAGRPRTQVETAAALVAAGVDVVSVSDHPGDIDELLTMHETAVANNASLVIGAGFDPGLSCLLVSYAAKKLDSVDSVSTAKSGTGGPDCARQHHWALKHSGLEWHDNSWTLRRGGSGRDLVWFPDPVGARDCYRAALGTPVLLQRALPNIGRISARMSATRRDRLTGRLPMLRPPHADGGPGAIRAEVRGRQNGKMETLIYGVMDHPSVAAGTMAAVAALETAVNRAPVGAYGLASWPRPAALLAKLHHRGVRVASFDGYLSLEE